ncbi:MAG: M24 family metallopeptidase, partial [Chloroflexota bacterium]
LDAILLTRNDNIAWATGGARPFIAVNQDTAVCAILSDAEGFRLLANNIEEGRLLAEELPTGSWRPIMQPWYRESLSEGLRQAGVSRIGADSNVEGALPLTNAIAELRTPLLEPEIERYRSLGHDTGQALEQAAREVRQGDSEFQIAGRMAAALMDRAIDAPVLLVAVDDRIQRVRHPLPTTLKVSERAMLVCCGRRHGLIASATRLIHLGPVPDVWRQRQEACARVDGAYLAATIPGATAAQIFAAGEAAYTAEGYPGEWEHHHQGGAAGYGTRDWFATPTGPETAHLGQAFAWNPSIAGAKVEDTVLLGERGIEILTATGEWPVVEVEAGGTRFLRPAILG